MINDIVITIHVSMYQVCSCSVLLLLMVADQRGGRQAAGVAAPALPRRSRAPAADRDASLPRPGVRRLALKAGPQGL